MERETGGANRGEGVGEMNVVDRGAGGVGDYDGSILSSSGRVIAFHVVAKN